jgi:hypothetical protein
LAIAGIASRLPRVDDIRGALTRLADLERHTNSAYEQQLAKLQQRQVTPDQFAQEIERQVLPPWNAARDEFARMRAGPEQQAMTNRVRYMSLRSEAMHLMAEGLKANDPVMLQTAQQKTAEANALVRTLTPQSSRRSTGHTATEVSISGTIKEIALPIDGALVSLNCPPQPKPPVSRVYLQLCASPPFIRSDPEGRFAFSHVPPGNYLVRVKADAYVPEEQPVEIREDVTLAFSLRPAVDVKGVVAGVSAVEADTVRRLNAALGQLRAHRISNDRFSQSIQTEVLPVWDKRRAELERLQLTPGQRPIIQEIIKYMQLRGESWRLLAKAVQTNDAALMKAAKRKQDEAMTLAKTFGTPVQPPQRPARER